MNNIHKTLITFNEEDALIAITDNSCGVVTFTLGGVEIEFPLEEREELKSIVELNLQYKVEDACNYLRDNLSTFSKDCLNESWDEFIDCDYMDISEDCVFIDLLLKVVELIPFDTVVGYSRTLNTATKYTPSSSIRISVEDQLRYIQSLEELALKKGHVSLHAIKASFKLLVEIGKVEVSGSESNSFFRFIDPDKSLHFDCDNYGETLTTSNFSELEDFIYDSI